MALRADERRDKLRKAAVRSKYPVTRRYLNGATRLREPQSLYGEYIAMQGEPGELKHLSTRRKRKKQSIPKVAASEMGRAQTGVRAYRGYGLHLRFSKVSRTVLGKPAEESESLVSENMREQTVSGVPRDTRNPVGRREDHLPRLNTT